MNRLFVILLVLVIIGALTLNVRYGSGDPYPDLSATPRLDDAALEVVLSYSEPVGNVAVGPDGRVFFTVHPEARPEDNKLLEWVDDAAEPYPNGTVQPHLFDTVLGLVIDRHNRLWTIDHGNHGFRTARLLAFDLASGDVVHDHEFRAAVAPAGSMLQDLQVSADGRTVFIADASIWRKSPALVVYDVETRSARRVLESHPSVSAEDYLIRTPTRDMSYLGGLVSLKAGVDGIAIDADNTWLYYGAINQSGLYRIAVRDLLDPGLPAGQLSNRVQRYSDKPMSDGLSSDIDGNVYVTDVEHGAVMLVDRDRRLTTLIKSSQIRWADGLSFGPDGWLYLADSAIPDLVLKSSEHVAQQGPYFIFRFRPGHAGIPGH